MMYNDIENLFNTHRLEEYKKHRQLNILGIKIKIKEPNIQIDSLKLLLLRIQKKLSLTDNICRVGNSKFYVPNYPVDFIQRELVESGKFFEQEELEKIKKYLPGGGECSNL